MNTKDMWIKRNSFDHNEEYAIKILDKFSIAKYSFTYDTNGHICLILEKNLKKYKISIDTKQNRMNIYKCNVRSFNKFTKEKMVLKKFFEEDCIWDSIKWVSKDCSM